MDNARTGPTEFERFFTSAEAAGFEVTVQSRGGILFLLVNKRGLGPVAMWPAFDGSLETTARYAMDCFQQLASHQQ